MSIGTCCSKCLLILFNSILLSIGLVMIAGGIFVRVGANQLIVHSYIKPVYEQFQHRILNSDGTTTTTIPKDFNDILVPIGTVLIIVGCIITAVSLLGVFGAWCGNRVLLAIYCAILVLLIIAQIVLVIIFFSHALDRQFRTALKKTLDNYVDIDDMTPASVTWNLLMVNLHCCGIDNYMDFSNSSKWAEPRNITFNGMTRNLTLVTPIACCKFDENHFFEDTSCAAIPQVNTSNWKTGCWKQVQKELTSHRAVAVGVICGVIITQLLLFVFAMVILCSMRNKTKASVV